MAIKLPEETRDAINSGIPVGTWTGKTRGVRFTRVHGVSEKTGNKYDIRRVTLSVNPLAPLSGEDVPDGKAEESLSNLAQEFSVRGLNGVVGVLNRLADDLGVDIPEGDQEEFADSLLPGGDVVSEDGVVDYEKLSEEVSKYGRHYRDVDVTFTLSHDSEAYTPYTADNVLPA